MRLLPRRIALLITALDGWRCDTVQPLYWFIYRNAHRFARLLRVPPATATRYLRDTTAHYRTRGAYAATRATCLPRAYDRRLQWASGSILM